MRTPSIATSIAFALLVTLVVSRIAHAQDGLKPDATLERIAMTKALVIDGVSGGGRSRSVAAIDPIQRRFITGTWKMPKNGDEVTLGDGSKRAWSEVEAGADGTIPADKTRSGYALWLVDSDADKIMLLNARGHGMAYVNGEERAGDPYDNGIVSLPVKLHKGVNEILLQCPRGAVKAELVEPASAVMISTIDATLPDVVRGFPEMAAAGVVIVNASDNPLVSRMIEATDASGREHVMTPIPTIPALSVRKCRVNLPAIEAGESNEVVLRLSIMPSTVGATSCEIKLDAVESVAMRKRTFVSDIDGSVQYFAMRPALKLTMENALILTLHGASVEARSQAAAYKSKEWAHIVAPTNRRPFGFDWEDWGRLDAIEVLNIAKAELAIDRQQVYLTGHSMGGHGTWQIGSTFPGEFAAIAPSAGWISFESYSGGREAASGIEADAMKSIMRRAGNASRTLELQHNLEDVGIYILHGEKDDNVPVEQARTMKAELDKWHHDLEYHEQPGAGHWWGDECVDWPPLMEFLRKHRKPDAKAIDHVMFATASPGVSASRDWAMIMQQQKAMSFSRIDLNRDLAKHTITGSTENVARLALDGSDFDGLAPITIELDGQQIRAQASPFDAMGIQLIRTGDRWSVAASSLAPTQKTPARCGLFKSAFNHRFMFVYGTKGTPEESAWALNKARFDAETFWYRGNGSVDVIADVEFDPSDAATRDRSVILYGNADTNAAWDALLHDSPVQVRRGAVAIGKRELKGNALACLLVRPRPSSGVASVGVVCGSGAVGARITDRLPYFVSGVAYPDCIVFDGGELSRGGSTGLAITAAGFFGNDWSVEAGDFAWDQ